MNRIILLLLLAAVCVLTSCSPRTSSDPPLQPSPPVNEELEIPQAGLPDVFPDLDTVTDVYVLVNRGYYELDMRRAYARADETQASRLIYLLSLIDTDSFEPCSREGVGGAGADLRIDSATMSRDIRIIYNTEKDDGVLYVVFPAYCEDGCVYGDSEEAIEQCWARIERETLYFRGSPGTFSLIDLNNAGIAVLSDDTDMENTGTVTILDSGEPELVLNKAFYAAVRQILDGTIHRAAADTVPDDFMYNVRFTAPDAVYLLDTETGYFSREMDGEIKYGELAENWREQAFSRLGVLNHVAR